jgi:hypothetical protein
MRRRSIRIIVVAGVFLSVLVALAMATQDKYIVKVPGGLAFSEFRGYEAWHGRQAAAGERRQVRVRVPHQGED